MVLTMLQLHVVLDQPKGWLDYVMALGPVVAAVAALIAVIVTRTIARNQNTLQETLANKQFDLQKAQQEQQERQLKKDLFDRRFAVFKDTGEFISPILSTPTSFTPQGDGYRRFGETLQLAEMLFDPEVREYLEDINSTAVDLWASNQRRIKDPGDNHAIEENAEQFQHLLDLWKKRPEVFRRDMSLG
jgi:type II secretory pathway pseudopilin PulG